MNDKGDNFMTKCYTFYSYKGGSGRSTTSVNTVKHLIDELKANKDRPILVVDSDLESAGLTYFFKCEKKFTNRVPYPLHTTYIFSAASSALEGDNGDLLFGVEDPDARSLVSDQRAIREMLTSNYGSDYDIDATLNGLDLLNCEMVNLKRIIECSSKSTVTKQQKKISETYSLPTLLNRLYSVETDFSLSSNEKSEKKRKVTRDFLPATSFVDISDYFGVEEGTVKFLGADVHYEEAQLLKIDTTVEVIDELRELCDSHGYAAIVFDSGAGVQSSADALQRASHVLVYCMRPTQQFRKGTITQLANYSEALKDTLNLNKVNGDVTEDSKIVILLPTAVPLSARNDKWLDDAFSNINFIVNINSDIVDGSFCTKDTCLNEVELFKWEEKILLSEKGTDDAIDEDRAFNVYKNLAKKLVEFTDTP